MKSQQVTADRLMSSQRKHCTCCSKKLESQLKSCILQLIKPQRHCEAELIDGHKIICFTTKLSALYAYCTSASTDPLMSISSRHLFTEISRILEHKLWHVMRGMFEKELQQIAFTGLLGSLQVQTCLPL